MKKVIFIFLILISCLCLAVVSCADKEESSTSSSSTDNTTTISIVDGSAEGYMKIGNMLMVWGNGTTEGDNVAKTVNFPASFSETPSVTATTVHTPTGYVASTGDNVRINAVTTSTTSIYISNARNFHYIAVGKWQ